MKSSVESSPEQTGAPRPWDLLAEELQTLREARGDVSYAEIARLISEARQAAGASPHAARIARSTVFDCFRLGRGRVNLRLVREIALVLGATDADVDSWIAECRNGSVPESSPAYVEDRPPLPPTARQVLTLMLGCVAISMAGRILVDVTNLPIYLDMVGTAIAAIALGPWRGAVVGGVTNVVGVVFSGWVSIPFGIVNIAGALVWGYGVRRYGFGRTLPRFFLLHLLVAAVCTLLAVPILVLVFGGSVGQGQDSITQTFLDMGNALVVAVGFSNILTSVADKVISGFVALVVITSLPAAFRYGANLVFASPTDT